MRCTVLLPSLFSPAARGLGIGDLPLPALSKLLAKSRLTSAPPQSLEHWLLRHFGVRSGFPVAPLCLLGDGGDPGSRYWLRADPVHLALGNRHLVLARSAVLDLTLVEAEALRHSLNEHFRDRALQFVLGDRLRWYVGLDAAPSIETTPIAEVYGQHVDPFLPRGPEALTWHRLQNEIQMLLHTHPVNEAREANNQLAVNSVWFWGLGQLPAGIEHACSHVFSDDPLALGLARAAGLPALPCDPQALPSERSASVLVVLHRLRAASEHGDVLAWKDTLLDLEARWFAPLLALVRNGTIKELMLHALNTASHDIYTLRASDLWKFWRAAVPLARLTAVAP